MKMPAYPLHPVVVAAVAAVGLVGCGTPQVAKNQADHTVQLMSLMEEPLGDFRQTWTASEQSRLATLQTQKDLLLAFHLAAQRERLARTASGDKRSEMLRVKLLANADALKVLQDKAGDDGKAYADRLSKLLEPLPSTSAAVTQAQADVAKMGADLAPEQRIQELLEFGQVVAKGLKDNHKALQDAKSKSAAASDEVKTAVSAAASAASAATSKTADQ